MRISSSIIQSRHIFMPAIALLGILYSGIFPVNRVSAESGDPYIGYVFWFSLVSSIVLLFVGFLSRQLPTFSFAHIRAYAILGIVGVALPVPLLTFIAPKVPVGILTLELALVPLLTYLISWFLRIERFRLTGALALLLGLTGIIIVLAPGVSLPNTEMVVWAAVALIAPLCFACANAFAAYFRPPESAALAMAAGMSILSTLMLAPVIIITGQAYIYPGPAFMGNMAVLAAAAITAICTASWFVIVRRVGPVYFSQFNYFIVLGGFGWGTLLYQEHYSWLVWLAVGLTFTGLAIFSHGAAKAAKALELSNSSTERAE